MQQITLDDLLQHEFRESAMWKDGTRYYGPIPIPPDTKDVLLKNST